MKSKVSALSNETFQLQNQKIFIVAKTRLIMSKEIDNLIMRIKKRIEEIDDLMWQSLREGIRINFAYYEGLREAYKAVLEELEIIAIKSSET